MASRENQSGRLSRPENPTTTDHGTRTTGPYDDLFETLLINGGVYPEEQFDSDSEVQFVPGNLEEMKQKANEPRPSLSITNAQFRKFHRALINAKRESEVVALVVPLLEGQFRVSNQGFKDTTFSNFAPLVSEGLEGQALVQGTPDRCYGARFERLNERIRNELSNQVVPTNNSYV
ncbi:hypothetical protein FRX31_028380 [Thalictrum thalictroides]|uniref:Uncharacterized protein n=1 Tax=Thalictrum thalictroides TaxID=46969 RepID=A0A7J6VAV6_THATH|nr:hypothetical protein FRX31_028380 [Thalictrum thalictroides]